MEATAADRGAGRSPAAIPSSVDAVVVGAGILGLATARELKQRRPDWSVLVLEKEGTAAQHQTGRNSCVLHAGVYYAPGSLKARLCTNGRRLLMDFCDEHRLPYELTGKLVVATEEHEIGKLEELHRRAKLNGLAGLRLLTASQLRDVEPHAAGRAGLHVPETGIVDFRVVAEALQRELEEQESMIAFSAGVSSLRDVPGGVRVTTTRGSVSAKVAVACAGLQSDRLARASRTATADVAIVPFRGSYYALAQDAAARCRGMIYPVPDPRFPFLGVHVNRRPGGAVWVGPNAVLALAREGYRRSELSLADIREVAGSGAFWRLARRHWRTGVSEVTRDLVPHLVARAVSRLLPGVSRADLLPAPSGIRAQALHSNGLLADDFLFAESARVLHVQNAPSPAATSSLAIASVLAQKTLAKLDGR